MLFILETQSFLRIEIYFIALFRIIFSMELKLQNRWSMIFVNSAIVRQLIIKHRRYWGSILYFLLVVITNSFLNLLNNDTEK